MLTIPLESNEIVSDETLHFDYPGSDIVLRSCDSNDFRLPKLYIVNSSPVLRELIQNIPNTSDVPNGEEQGPLPVVNLRESKATLYSLLTFIFPVIPILPSTAEKIMELLAVAQKYQMDSVLSHIRGTVARQDPPFIRPETALHVYFLAQEHGLHQEAVQAARVTFRLSMTIEGLGDMLEFPGMTGAYLHELWKYHEQVRTDLRSVLSEFRNSGLPDDVKDLRCKTLSPNHRAHSESWHVAGHSWHNGQLVTWSVPPQAEDTDTCPQWLHDYIMSIAENPHLVDLIEFENAWAYHIHTGWQARDNPRAGDYSPSKNLCLCVGISRRVRRALWEALTAVIHGTIEKADSSLALVKEEPTSDSEKSDPPSVPLCLDIPDANIIVRSSDQVDFRVHKSVLSLSSPFFKDLLSLPQPTDEELVDGLQVVRLPEDADLLYSLVSLLYPVAPVMPQAGSYERVFALLAVCQKYEMVSIQSYIRAEIKRGTFPTPVEAEAFSAYAIASSMHLVPEMENAARLTLGHPLSFESLGEELRLFKGGALCDLVRYRVNNPHEGEQ